MTVSRVTDTVTRCDKSIIGILTHIHFHDNIPDNNYSSSKYINFPARPNQAMITLSWDQSVEKPFILSFYVV